MASFNDESSFNETTIESIVLRPASGIGPFQQAAGVGGVAFQQKKRKRARRSTNGGAGKTKRPLNRPRKVRVSTRIGNATPFHRSFEILLTSRACTEFFLCVFLPSFYHSDRAAGLFEVCYQRVTEFYRVFFLCSFGYSNAVTEFYRVFFVRIFTEFLPFRPCSRSLRGLLPKGYRVLPSFVFLNTATDSFRGVYRVLPSSVFFAVSVSFSKKVRSVTKGLPSFTEFYFTLKLNPIHFKGFPRGFPSSFSSFIVSGSFSKKNKQL